MPILSRRSNLSSHAHHRVAHCAARLDATTSGVDRQVVACSLRAQVVRDSLTFRGEPAITRSSVALCSTPYKVLRFAPTPLTRGLRTLTASVRSS